MAVLLIKILFYNNALYFIRLQKLKVYVCFFFRFFFFRFFFFFFFLQDIESYILQYLVNDSLPYLESSCESVKLTEM